MNQMKETTNVTTGENLKSRDDARMKVKKIAFIGLMGAVSAVLMLFRFPSRSCPRSYPLTCPGLWRCWADSCSARWRPRYASLS